MNLATPTAQNSGDLIEKITLEDQWKFEEICLDWQKSIINDNNETAARVKGEVEKLMSFRDRGHISEQMYTEVQNLIVAELIRYIRMDGADIIGQWYAWYLRITPEWVITQEQEEEDNLPL